MTETRLQRLLPVRSQESVNKICFWNFLNLKSTRPAFYLKKPEHLWSRINGENTELNTKFLRINTQVCFFSVQQLFGLGTVSAVFRNTTCLRSIKIRDTKKKTRFWYRCEIFRDKSHWSESVVIFSLFRDPFCVLTILIILLIYYQGG